MFIRWSAAIAAMTLLSGPALAEGAKLTDPQIAHIAYKAGVIDVTAGQQALFTLHWRYEAEAIGPPRLLRHREAMEKTLAWAEGEYKGFM